MTLVLALMQDSTLIELKAFLMFAIAQYTNLYRMPTPHKTHCDVCPQKNLGKMHGEKMAVLASNF